MLDNFFKYFYEDIGRIFQAFWEILLSFGNFFNFLFNFPMRMKLIKSHSADFGTPDWILLLITHIILVALAVTLVVFIVKLFRHIFRFRVPVKKYDEVVRQVKNLQRDLIRANYEKDKLLSMKVAELGVSPD